MTYVCLLRGVNVGGNKMVKMEELRKTFESLGCTNVRTVLQSGNVIFDAKTKPRDLESHLGVPVVLRTQAEIRKAIEANPFPDEAEHDPGHLLVVFLSAPLPSDEPLRKVALPHEKFAVKGKEIYIHFGQGAGRSKLAAALTEKKLGVVPTARNWNTVGKLV
ncbi:MAG TPA: DUF1697 domain-containing protein [Thermoanaerobaculia bacterium]|nr:DUF1697 domain-containing protein [Thermoanaerobaculia bacterium]